MARIRRLLAGTTLIAAAVLAVGAASPASTGTVSIQAPATETCCI